jgi:hypothetical protein
MPRVGGTWRSTTVTNPGETLASRRIAWSDRLDLLALDRSVPEGYLMTTAATSGAFRPASDYIETEAPSDLEQRDRELLYPT